MKDRIESAIEPYKIKTETIEICVYVYVSIKDFRKEEERLSNFFNHMQFRT